MEQNRIMTSCNPCQHRRPIQTAFLASMHAVSTYRLDEQKAISGIAVFRICSIDLKLSILEVKKDIKEFRK